MTDVLCVSDNDQNRLVIVDVSQMKVLRSIRVGSQPYPVDSIRQNLVLVSTRGLKERSTCKSARWPSFEACEASA